MPQEQRGGSQVGGGGPDTDVDTSASAEASDGDGVVGRNPISNGFVNLKAFVCCLHTVSGGEASASLHQMSFYKIFLL